MDKNDRQEVHDWRRKWGRCLVCGGLHELYDCERRNKQITKKFEGRKRAIESGKLTIIYEFTGPLATKLPIEIRLMIWRELLESRYSILARRGMMSKYFFNYGFPFGELLEVWLSHNTFCMRDVSELKRFDRLSTKFNGHQHVRRIEVVLESILHSEAESTLSLHMLTDFAAQCTSLRKLTCVTNCDTVHIPYNKDENFRSMMEARQDADIELGVAKL
jgi:hypothetical protein